MFVFLSNMSFLSPASTNDLVLSLAIILPLLSKVAQ